MEPRARRPLRPCVGTRCLHPPWAAVPSQTPAASWVQDVRQLCQGRSSLAGRKSGCGMCFWATTPNPVRKRPSGAENPSPAALGASRSGVWPMQVPVTHAGGRRETGASGASGRHVGAADFRTRGGESAGGAPGTASSPAVGGCFAPPPPSSKGEWDRARMSLGAHGCAGVLRPRRSLAIRGLGDQVRETRTQRDTPRETDGGLMLPAGEARAGVGWGVPPQSVASGVWAGQYLEGVLGRRPPPPFLPRAGIWFCSAGAKLGVRQGGCFSQESRNKAPLSALGSASSWSGTVGQTPVRSAGGTVPRGRLTRVTPGKLRQSVGNSL